MDTIQTMRRFNRFYTGVLGLFSPKLMGSGQTLVEARILYEIWRQPGMSSADLMRLLDMDRGQLSKVITRLAKQGLLLKNEKHAGRRGIPLNPTPKGVRLAQELDAMSNRQAATLLVPLNDKQQGRLIQAMGEIETMLSASSEPESEVTIRSALPGDLGWVVERHAKLYRESHGFNEEFEKYVLLGLAEYLRKGAGRSRLWMAERDAQPLGSIAIVEQEPNMAQMRWLIVDPLARGLGVGRMLAEKAIAFSREENFDAVFLWTIDSLLPAIRMYKSLGFVLSESKTGEMGGVLLTEQRWELAL